MNLLAFDTSTEIMSLAVQRGSEVFTHEGAGGAQASQAMLPAIASLMQQAGLRYEELDAIVFGRGPGSFTGLRTACSVAQGLAFGANTQVLPVDTLLCVAQVAHEQTQASHILAALDARIGEVYAEYYSFDSKLFNQDTRKLPQKPQKPDEMMLLELPPDTLLAGNIRPIYDAALPPAIRALRFVPCLPTARALLALAPGLIARGDLVAAQDALPLYVRDKVALTTLEREQAARAK
jgi:tRNA threonylcarbamoyladenosine biosynthesis protein TsaB